ncbi:MOSC domain-containing protein [Neisseria sp. Dent CA1/247]|uniref:MOSC domain-containing protein n=1 Tax=Neisseria sp. Dent CA1/247 TaxID=2912675 RepID=UPI001FD15E1B|nr:MOSC domain-containing protein [Neisseria sp. Dent CA1/247]UOO78050.1 MOSC domain-containing protein [Neisseria sp. Dent CA1/247]
MPGKRGRLKMKLTSIARYPVKSMGGNVLAESAVTPVGLPHDREWLVATPQGGFITARKFPQMLLWQTDAAPDRLTLTAPDGSSRAVYTNEMVHTADVTVWKDCFPAYHGSAETDAWLSERLGTDARLYWLGGHSKRVLAYSQTPLSFADSAPFLLTNTASLDDLNAMLDTPVEMERFRANFVVSGKEAYEEETWHRIRIGEVEFEHFKPCTRCVMTTVDLKTAKKDPFQEPLSTLAIARKAIFGVHLVALNQGVVKAGDEVEVLSYK